jgi:glycosyltransferase involved in cell wall biosynthesis
MKLSIVIPAYNEEKYLGKCLESIFRELHGKNYDVEIIVVNNASTDGTKMVATAFAGVKVVDEVRKGLVQARQTGFLASDGDLIANLDADTMLPSGWIDRVLAEFSRDERLVALSGPFIFYDLPTIANLWVKFFFLLGAIGSYLGDHILRRGSLLQGGNYILKRQALERIGGYNLQLRFFGEDADVAKRIGKVGRVKFTLRLPMYTSGRRLKAEGILRTGFLSFCDDIWIMFSGRPFRKLSDERDIRLDKDADSAGTVEK